ncbi:tyrosine-type recombinase/integrase (plasmid) [Bacillus salacetis]|uniref:tyrosine-type recombinase/integrase n=1 Tax=Bacillus salacetis TaxID=2315464 RepID=UPI003BA3724D
MGKRRKKQNKSKKNNLEIAKGNVLAAFREAKKAGITVNKENMRESAYESYQKSMITMLNDLAGIQGVDSKRLLPKYMNGKSWDEYFEHLSNRYESGSLSAGQIQRRVHALEAFRHFVNETNVCGNTKIRVGNKEERLNYLKFRGVVRSKDEITAIKPSNEEVAEVHSNINTRTESGRLAQTINKLQFYTGARIKSVFKLEVRDIDFDKGTISFRNDKNNFSRTIPLNKEAKDLLEDACNGKKPGAFLFTIKGRDGNDKKIEDAVKVIQSYTTEAAKSSGVNRENRRFSTHSNRKGYAQNFYSSTRYMSSKQIKKLIGEFVKNQGSNREQIVARMKTELDRINTYRKKRNLKKKGFSHEQLRRLLVSLHLGHSRCDIVLSYIKPDKKSTF